MPTTGGLTGSTVVVVGAGVVGAAVAYRLGEAGAAVVVVEAGYPGGGTSGNSFGWLNAFNKVPRAYHRLNTRAIGAHRDLEDELGGRWLTRTGGLHWSAADGGSAYTGDLGRTLTRMREWGTRVTEHDASEVTGRLEPALCLPPDAGSVHLVADEGWVQPALLVQALLAHARDRYAAQLRLGRVVALSGAGGGVDSVLIESGERIGADVVVLASGVTAGELAAAAGGVLRLERQPGTLVVTAPAPVGLRRVLLGPRLIARPGGGGRVMLSDDTLLSCGPDDREAVPEQWSGSCARRGRCCPSCVACPSRRCAAESGRCRPTATRSWVRTPWCTGSTTR